MKDEAIPTPFPWAVNQDESNVEDEALQIKGPNGWLIARLGDGESVYNQDRANAAFIVRACNSYEAMLTQLRATQAMLIGRGLISHDPDMNELFNLNARAIDDAEGRTA